MKTILSVSLSLVIAATLVVAAESKSDSENEFVIKPPYMDAPEMAVKEGVPKGTVHEFTMKSEDSKIYPGIDERKSPGQVVPYKRDVVVYIPADYKPGTEVPFIVVQDGKGYVKRVVPTLDNMIHDKRLPPMVAIMINSGGGDGKKSERGLEYDTVSDKYTMFIENEVLPKIEKDYGVKFTKNPDGRATMGGSSGGSAAFTMAWFHPELYHRVLTYSGTYVNQQWPDNPESPHGAWEYHEHLIPNSEAKPIRIWLHVSENDNGAKSSEEGLHNWVLANQRMTKVLKDKGYKYRYVFAEDAKHVDGRVVGQTLPDALEWLWQGYKAD